MKTKDTIINLGDRIYPSLLTQIPRPPKRLFVRGNLKLLDKPAITVIGSRQMTQYGKKVTNWLVKELVNHGLVIVSGLALGVDAQAQKKCLEAGGKTVAVFGHGLDRIYPDANRTLAQNILKKGGLWLTEYPPGTEIKPGNFKARDRIMAGLTPGTLVIEGKQRSGTKVTASFAVDYGREVFAVPGPIDSPTAVGPGELIQQGAKLILSAEDIFSELKIRP